MFRLATTVARNAVLVFSAQTIVKALSMAFAVLVVRRLGADMYGQYAAVGAFGALFVFLADLGLSPFAVREFARWRDRVGSPVRARRLYGNLLALRLSLAVLAALLMIFTAWLTHRPWLMIGAIALNALGLGLYAVEGATEAALAGHEQFGVAARGRVVQQVVFIALGTAALLWIESYYGLILASVLSILALTLVCWRGAWQLGLRPQRPTPRLWRLLLRRALPFGLIGLALGLSYKFDTVLLNVFRTDRETGYYNAAYTLVFSAIGLSNIINTALYPSLTRQTAAAPERLPVIAERMLRYLSAAAWPIAWGGCVVAEPLVKLLYGADFGPSAQALAIVIWAVPLMFASEFLGYIVVISRQEGRVARAVLVSSSINVVCNALLIPRFGLVAAAAMTVVTEAVLVLQHGWTLRAMMRRMNWRPILVQPVLAAALMAALVWLTAPWPVLARVALGAAAYAVLLIVLRVVGPVEWQFVRRFPLALGQAAPKR